MAQHEYNINLFQMLMRFMNAQDPMLEMLRWLCNKLMEAELQGQLKAGKSERTDGRTGYRSGYRVRRFDTRMGTVYLLVPKVRKGGYVPFFVTARKRSETALMSVIQEAYVNGVSTRKIERLAKELGIESISHGQVSVITKDLNERVEAFRTRPLSGEYRILWVDALYEKVRLHKYVKNVAVLVVAGVDQDGRRDILAVEPMLEESEATYKELFRNLKARGLNGKPWLVVSDAHPGLVKAVQKEFVGSSWQRCKVHFMRNVLAHVAAKEKDAFAQQLKQIWQQPDADKAREYARWVMDTYERAWPDAIRTLEEGLEDTLSYYQYSTIDSRKVSSTNILERLNKEVRRRTRVVGIFPSMDSYLRLVTSYMIEYSEEWSAGRCYISSDTMAEAEKQAEQSA